MPEEGPFFRVYPLELEGGQALDSDGGRITFRDFSDENSTVVVRLVERPSEWRIQNI